MSLPQDLNPIARRELIDILIETLSDDDGCTVIFSTHIVSDLERIANYVGIMDHGRMLVSSPIEELQSFVRRVQIIFEMIMCRKASILPALQKFKSAVRSIQPWCRHGMTSTNKFYPEGIKRALMSFH